MTTISGTTPYAWPYNGHLEPARTAVLRVVAGPGLGAAGPARDRADEVIARIRRFGGTVIHVFTVPPRRATPATVEAGDPIADIFVSSHGIDGFYGSALDAELRTAGLDRLILVGDGLETCVHSTLRSANDRGYECLLVLDACQPHDPGLVDSSRSQIEMSGGIFGAVADSVEVCRTLDSLNSTLVPSSTD